MAFGNRKFSGFDQREFLVGRPRLANTSDDILTFDVSGIREGYGLSTSITTDSTGGYRGTYYLDGATRFDFLSIERFNITATDYADSVQVGNGDDVVRLGGGNDLVVAGYGKDTLDGGAGIDGLNKSFLTATTAITVNLTTNTITASQGTIANFEYFSNVIGGTKNDTFVSSQFRGDDSVTGGDGNDRAEFKIGNDGFTGGAGTDTLKSDMSWYTGTEGIQSSLNVDAAGGYSGYFYVNGGTRANYASTEAFEVLGTKNNDSIVTGNGNDILSGNGGNDDIRSGTGTDVLDGGDGIDGVGRDFSAATGAVTMDLNTSTLTGGPGSIANFEYFSAVSGGAFADTFVSTTAVANDTVVGGGGDDTGTFYAGYDRFTGGLGTDRVVIDYSARLANAGITTGFSVDANGGYSGYIYIDNASRVDFSSTEGFSITGTIYDDRINVGNGAGDDVIKAGAGWDIVNSGGGADVLDGGTGIDGVGRNFINNTALIKVDLEANTSQGIGGSIKNFEYFTSFVSGSGNDTLATTHLILDDTVVMGGGNDTFVTYAGHDRYTAGVGNDRLVLDWSAIDLGSGVTVSQNTDANGGYQGYYYINNSAYLEYSSVENFTLTGTLYNDTLVAKEGNDILIGGAGDDILSAGSGNDAIDGGGGIDGFGKDFSASRADIAVDLDANTISLAGTTIANVEYASDLRTGSGNDTILTTHLRGNDFIVAGGGNDTASFFSGYDKYQGGSGNKDTLIADYSALDTENTVQTSISVDSANGGFQGYYYVEGGNRVDFTGVEYFDVTGTRNNDTLTGGENADIFNGGDGRDTLNGAEGNDKLDGGTAGDTLNGGTGNDTLTGGEGSDTLTGGDGADKFVFGNGDTGPGLAYIDRIVDFATGTDTIDLSRIDADKATAGNQAFSFVGSAAFTAAGQVHVVLIGGINYIQGNVDADLGADFTIRIDGTIPVLSDFVL